MSGTVIPSSPGPQDPAPSRRAVLAGVAALPLIALAPEATAHARGSGPGVAPARRSPAAVSRQIAQDWWRPGEGSVGTGTGTLSTPYGLRIGVPIGRRDYTDPSHAAAGARSYDYATWDSPVVTPGFAWTELIASWNVDTPADTWVEVLVRGLDAAGTPTAWLALARWCANDVAAGGAIQRTSVPGQSAAGATVATDTLQTRGSTAFRSWQLRVVLLRRTGTSASPMLRLSGAVASAVPDSGSASEPTSPFGGTVSTLAVPTYSQELHSGHYTAWGGGGESWCSATTIAMILDYWGAGPTAAEKSWVNPPVDAQVDVAARAVYDAAYGGTGNWPFNTAYAGTRTAAGVPLTGFVTRLRDLAAAEPYLRSGIPLGVSLSFTAGQLAGAGYSTAGHLMVLVGFDAAGNPVVNDPASHLIADNSKVRVTYQRAQFERAWANSGRTAYVVRPGTAPPGPPVPPTAPVSNTPAVPITPGSRSVPRRW